MPDDIAKLAALKFEAPGFTNPRRPPQPDKIRELARSIAINGLLVPLLVRDDGLVLGGQRRLLAIRLLVEDPRALAKTHGEAEAFEQRARELAMGVPVHMIWYDTESGAADVAALADNLEREGLHTFDLAESVTELSHKMPQVEIARRLNLSRGYVSALIKSWRRSSDVLRAAWRSDAITFREVRDLAKLGPDEQAEALAARAGGKPGGEAAPAGAAAGAKKRPGIQELRDLVESAGEQVSPEGYGCLMALRFAIGEISLGELPLELDE